MTGDREESEGALENLTEQDSPSPNGGATPPLPLTIRSENPMRPITERAGTNRPCMRLTEDNKLRLSAIYLSLGGVEAPKSEYVRSYK